MIKNYRKFSKTISVAVITLTLLVGCSTGEQQSNNQNEVINEKAPIEQIITDENSTTMKIAKSIIDNKDNYHFLSEVQDILEGKTPYLSVFYANQADIEGEEPGETSVIEYIYPIEDSGESSALKVYSQYHELSDVKIDEFVGTASADYADTDYKMIKYAKQNVIKLDGFSLDSVKNELESTDVAELNYKLNVANPTVEVLNKGTNSKVYLYIIGDAQDSENKGLFVLSKDGKIENIKLGETSVNLGEIKSLFDALTY